MNTYEYQKLRGLKRKLELIESRGGKCENEDCGYGVNIAALDFHHINSTTKTFKLDIRNLSNRKMSDILLEFKKCIVLCANCHREAHHPDLQIKDLKKTLENVGDNIFSDRTINKPKCVDCDAEINYSYRRCKRCSSINKRKVSRPSYPQLMQEITETNYVVVGKKYGVSDNTIRKWVKQYEKQNF